MLSGGARACAGASAFGGAAPSTPIYRIIWTFTGQDERNLPLMASGEVLRRRTQTICPMREEGSHDMRSRDHLPIRDSRAGSGIPGFVGLPMHPGGTAERRWIKCVSRDNRRFRVEGWLPIA
jgi:hypothetical protein